MDFKAFMQENVLPVENKKIVLSNRFVEDGKPVEWEIRALSNPEDDALRADHTVMKPAPGKAGKRGGMMPVLDTDAYQVALAATCVVNPDLTNAALQDNWGVKKPEALLHKMLTPGELGDLIYEVQMHNGFGITIEDKVDEAKNS